MSQEKPEYRIAYHRVVRNQIRTCLDMLTAEGWDQEELIEVLASVEQRLKADPSNCGEPLFNHKALEMTIAVVCARPFCIHFGIQEKTHSVLVREISLMTLPE